MSEKTFTYSEEFHGLIAEYVTGDPDSRSEKVIHEISTKLGWTLSFFRFAERYTSLEGKRFIEIGCGTGFVSVAASMCGATSIAATELDEKAIALASHRFAEHGVNANIFRSDLRDPIKPERREAFDFVWCFQVLEHIPRTDQFRALRNVFDYVAPGGFVFIDSENSLAPFDRHDTHTWLVRLLTRDYREHLIDVLGRGIDFFEPSFGRRIQMRDYLSFDEIVGAAAISGFRVVDPFMPHGDKRTYLRSISGSDWLHDTIGKYFEIERFAPVSLLLQKE